MFVKIERTNTMSIMQCRAVSVERSDGDSINLAIEEPDKTIYHTRLSVLTEQDLQGIYLMSDDGKTIEIVWRR